ncbi:hypothetical protein BDB01DRAFT_895097 [Pilobolus umbonatus]|nr:hypothetical protein BDB01DRAFT_895097 [Pilobolus umbonatus]
MTTLSDRADRQIRMDRWPSFPDCSINVIPIKLSFYSLESSCLFIPFLRGPIRKTYHPPAFIQSFLPCTMERRCPIYPTTLISWSPPQKYSERQTFTITEKWDFSFNKPPPEKRSERKKDPRVTLSVNNKVMKKKTSTKEREKTNERDTEEVDHLTPAKRSRTSCDNDNDTPPFTLNFPKIPEVEDDATKAVLIKSISNRGVSQDASRRYTSISVVLGHS